MYTKTSIHKNINPNYPAAYISIGDPYKDPDRILPERWQKKQFQSNAHPKNADNSTVHGVGGGYFIKLEHPKNEPYVELAEPYAKTQPIDKRKLGFGTHDANKRGEFTSTRATERYRDLLNMEKQLMEKSRNKGTEEALVKKWDRQARSGPVDRNAVPLKEAKHLYDIGRTLVTPYNPYGLKDTYYTMPRHAPIDAKNKGADPVRRLGPYKPMSADIGEMAWSHQYCKPEHGQAHYVDKFFDRGHLEVKGL